jgi:hypothetical protein
MYNKIYHEDFSSTRNETRPHFADHHILYSHKNEEESEESIQEFLQILMKSNSGENLIPSLTLNQISANIDEYSCDRYLTEEGISMLGSNYEVPKLPIIENLPGLEEDFDYNQLANKDYKISRAEKVIIEQILLKNIEKDSKIPNESSPSMRGRPHKDLK